MGNPLVGCGVTCNGRTSGRRRALAVPRADHNERSSDPPTHRSAQRHYLTGDLSSGSSRIKTCDPGMTSSDGSERPTDTSGIQIFTHGSYETVPAPSASMYQG